MQLVKAGYFSKTHGLKGELLLKEQEGTIDFETKVLFIDLPTGRAPYFVSSMREFKSGVLVHLEEVDTVEKARSLIGKPIYCEDEYFFLEEELDYTGYELIDGVFGSLGPVLQTDDNGVQILLTVKVTEKEVILPLVEDFIESIDDTVKIIRINAPKGLIEMYLQ
jgi:16S rRNA processing protein RimM